VDDHLNNKIKIMMMKDRHKGLKDLLQDIQSAQLDHVGNVISEIENVPLDQIRAKGGNGQIKRKIAYVARLNYYIDGNLISKYLNLPQPQVSDHIHTAHEKCEQSAAYADKINFILNKLKNK
jgi:hypothetical protein